MSDLVGNPEDRLSHNEAHIYEPRCEKTGLRDFRPDQTQTRLYNHTRWLEAGNFVFSKYRDCTIYVAKTKALISFVVTAKLFCVFVFAYAKSRFSYNEAHMISCITGSNVTENRPCKILNQEMLGF